MIGEVGIGFQNFGKGGNGGGNNSQKTEKQKPTESYYECIIIF